MEPNDEQQEDAGHPTSKDELLIVGIGASAGGIQALQRFFQALPEDGAVVFVVILHLDPERESSLADVLRPHTSLTVRQVTERLRIEPGHVYVIPPNKSLSITNSHLALSDFDKPRGRRAPIDLFFRSLAQVHGRGVGIVLSGSGTDGTVGLKAIKEQGGLVMAQVPEDAEYDAMPRNAIATGMVDFILPVEELAQKVIEYQKNRHRIQVPEEPEALPQDDAEALHKILAQLRTRTGHDFSDYKRSTVLRRIGRRMQMNQIESLSGYLHYLRNHPAEAQALLKNLLISVTLFFRDREAWEALEETVLPAFIQNRSPEEQVRIWVPGCATGEEAYTVAMLLLEQASRLDAPPEIQIFASDLDDEALAYGRQGLYPEAIAADITEERLRRFFTKEGDHYGVKKEMRERVIFAAHSLLKDPPFSKLDLISCRNLLIYLNRDLQENVFRLFHYALRPGGYLFLGSAESADGEVDLFQAIDKKHRIYRRPETGEAPRLPTLQLSGRATPERLQATATPVERTTPSELKRHRQMLEQQAPPSVVVSRSYDLLHLSDTAGRYLQRSGGRPSNDVLLEVRPELRLDVQEALHQAFERGKSTSTRPIEVAFNGDTGWVHLIVQPGQEEHGTQDQALVLFVEVETTSLSGVQGPGEGAGDDVRVRQLEEEVQRLRERLQATIEEYESSKEEMKAANEELQSINEEYKSTTEELETSKEELQSVNEELETVNQELKSKVEELGQANSDLQNLMVSTEIGTLFLDRNLRIQRYRILVENVQEYAIIMLNVEGQITTWNVGAERFFGYGEDEVIGQSAAILFTEEDREAGVPEQEMEKAAQTGQASDERWHVRQDGSRFWGSGVMTALHFSDGALRSFAKVMRDNTERKRAEEALRASESRYRAIFNTVGVSIWEEDFSEVKAALEALKAEGVTDVRHYLETHPAFVERMLDLVHVRDVNEATLKMVGASSKEELLGPLSKILLPETLPTFREELIALASGQSFMTAEASLKTLQGERLDVLFTLTAEADPAYGSVLVSMLDITRRRRAEERVKQFNETLEKQVEERTQQVRTLMRALTAAEQEERQRIAHVLHDDLQQQLYGLGMTLGLLRSARSEEEAQRLQERADTILDEATDLTRTLSVELSPPVLESSDLEEVLRWVALRKEDQYDLKVEVEMRGDVQVPERSLRVLLYQALREVLFNVVKHAGVDRARLTVWEEAGEVVVQVEDEGAGFDAAGQEKEESGKDGFGLFSVGERLGLMGGRFHIDSEPGRGTRVTLAVPIQDEDNEQA